MFNFWGLLSTVLFAELKELIIRFRGEWTMVELQCKMGPLALHTFWDYVSLLLIFSTYYSLIVCRLYYCCKKFASNSCKSCLPIVTVEKMTDGPLIMTDVFTYISPLCLIALFFFCFCRFLARPCISTHHAHSDGEFIAQTVIVPQRDGRRRGLLVSFQLWIE